MKFRKKPVIVDAIQALGTPESNREIIDWTRGSATPASMDDDGEGINRLSITTLEGAHWVTPGDWIIRGVKGEHYACKPDIFAATYELAASPAESPDVDRIMALAKSVTNEAIYVFCNPTADEIARLAAADRLADKRSALKAAVRALVPQWQPIETAPLDKRVLLWWIPIRPNHYAECAVTGEVSSHELGKFWTARGTYDDLTHVTHWMPLPAAPKETT